MHLAVDSDDELETIDFRDPTAPFQHLSMQARMLYLGQSITRVSGPLDPLVFYREYVAANKPVIIESTNLLKGLTVAQVHQDAISQWPALSRWQSDIYLRDHAGKHIVSVQWTPNGRADAVYEDRIFLKPEERRMTFNSFLDAISPLSKDPGVLYCSRQNSSFTDEFQPLWKDIPAGGLSWAEAAIGKPPEAVNMWIGTDKSVSSLHKDPFENIYAVVQGEKTFTLLPPTDYFFLYERPFPSGRYAMKADGSHEVIEEDAQVPWIPVDPDEPDLKRYPLAAHVKPYHAVVKAGEVLYLPSLWFHKVAQRGPRTMYISSPIFENLLFISAVNWWYDMSYDLHYNYYTFVERLSQRLHTQLQATG